MDSCHIKLSKCFLVPQRYIIAIMTSFAIFTSYTSRMILNLVISGMVMKEEEENTEVCGSPKTIFKDVTILYGWSKNHQNYILTSFYYSYFISHIPGALLAQRFNGKHIITVGSLISNFTTILTPIAITSSKGNLTVMIILRIVMGLGQGLLLPVVITILAQWSPQKERSFLISIVFSGAPLAIVVASTMLGQHWDVVFYFFGGLGLIWNVLWQIMCYTKPQTHPCITPKELVFLDENILFVSGVVKTPWNVIVKSISVWGLILTQFGYDWGWYTLLNHMPKFLKSVFHKNGQYLISVPFIFMWFSSLLSGYIADFLIAKEVLSLRVTRIIFGTLGTIIPGVFLVVTSYVGCDKNSIMILFCLVLFFMGFYFSGVTVNHLDLSPNFAGTILALSNGFGVFAGIASSSVINPLTTNEPEWRTILWITFGFLTISNIVLVICLRVNLIKTEE